MTIKIDNDNGQLNYPVVMQSLKANVLVLFFNKTKGIAIRSDDKSLVGRLSDEFINAEYRDYWRQVDVEITNNMENS